MGSKEMLVLKSSLCPQQRNKQEKPHCEKAKESGGEGKPCCVAWLSTRQVSTE